MKTNTQNSKAFGTLCGADRRPSFQGLEGLHVTGSSHWKLSMPVLLLSCWPLLGAEPSADEAQARKRLLELMNTDVSTVSRVKETLDDTPGSVYVYTREMIQKRGYRSLGELLQTVPGFAVFHRDLDFVTSVRGLAANDNDKVTILVNGQNVNGAHEQDFLNGPINLDNVERVEVVVGPSSFFQQANTLAATVNVITKNIDGSEVMVAAGNDLKYSATLMTGKKWADDRYLNFSFTTEEKKGFDAWSKDFRNGLAGNKQTGELEAPSYFSILNGRLGEWSAQAIAYKSVWPELHIENGSPGNHGDMIEEKYSLSLKNEHNWTPDLMSVVHADATLKKQTRSNRDGEDTANAVEQFVRERVYTAEIGLRYSGFERHLLQAGVQGSYNDNYDIAYSFHSDSPAVSTPKTPLVTEDTHGVGIYFDDTFQATEKLKLIGGIRADHNTRLDGDRWFLGARAGIILNVTTNWVTKLLYNRAVRMPSNLAARNEVWGSQHPDVSPFFATTSTQPEDPEILTTYEWQNIFYIGGARLTASIYHEEMSDFISWFGPHANGGNFSGNGAEVSVLVPLTPDVSLWANGSWNDSELHLFNNALFGSGSSGLEEHHAYVNPQGRIIGSPEYLANAGLDCNLGRHFVFSPALRYFTDQAAVDHTSNEYILIRDRYYLDAALTWKKVADRDLDVRLAGRNILDNRDPVGSQMNGDTYRPRGAEIVLSMDMKF